MTVKTVSLAVAYADANTPPSSTTAAGTVFKKGDDFVPETFARINDGVVHRKATNYKKARIT